MKNIKSLAIIIVAVLVIGAGIYYAVEGRKEYIDGNVLNLDISKYEPANQVMIPWRNNIFTSRLLYRTLFKPDHTLLNLSPDLATYEIKDDGLSIVVTLTKGNKWSDGEPITMDDVVWSIETAPKIFRAHYLYPIAAKNIESMEADGNVLTIRIKERSTMFMRTLAQIVILPKHKLSGYELTDMENPEFWKQPMTSGKYRYNTTVEGKYISFVKNEHYSLKKPKIDEIRMHMDATGVKIDYYHTTNSIAETINFRAMRGYTEYEVNMNFYRYWVFNVGGVDGKKNPAMEDVRVRQAICMAVDREKLLHNVYLNMGNLVDGKGTIGELGPYNYDPVRARELLAESDYDLNRPLRLTYYYSDPTSLDFMQQVAKQLEAIGFKVHLQMSTGPDFLYVDRPYDVMLKGFGAFQPAEWYEEYHSANFLSFAHGGKGELDDLIVELRGEFDPLKSEILLGELARKELEVLYKFPLFTLGQFLYINNERVSVPSSFVPGNFYYLHDMKFEDWYIKKD